MNVFNYEGVTDSTTGVRNSDLSILILVIQVSSAVQK